MRYTIFLFLILITVETVFSENRPIYNFNEFSLKNGLTQNTVRTILRDSEGYLWIGTSLGLNRFDGQQLTTFVSSRDSQIGLPGNNIYYIVEDKLNNIWVSSNNGLTLFNKNNQDFVIQYVDNSHFESYAYCLLSDGMICCSSGSLFKYDYMSRSWQRLPIVTNSQIAFHFTNIIPFNDENLLLGSRYNGLFLYNIKTGYLTETIFHSHKNTPTIFMDSKSRIWISAYGDGVYCYSQEGKLLHHYNNSNSQLSNDVVLDIIEIDENLWIGTDGGGINILNPELGTFENIKHTFENPKSFPANSVLSLYKDNWGSLWIGTVRNGLIEIKEVFMNTYGQVTFGNQHGLSYETVLSLYEDEDGYIWIGTDGGGINKFNPSTGIFEHFQSSINDKVTSITNYSKDELLISLFDQGIYFFDKRTGKKRKLVIIDEDIDSHITTSGATATLFSLDANSTQIISDDIYIYNKDTKSFSKTVLNKETNLSRRILRAITSDSEGEYLYASNKIFQKKEDTYDIIFSQPENADLITAVTKDKNGKLWVATSNGIRKFDPIVKNIGEYLSTPSQNIITSLVCDSLNRLWIGTRGDLWVYFIDENRFEVFNTSDGALTNEYLGQSTLITRKGDIYMGGVNGLLFIDKNMGTVNSEIPLIKLIEVATKHKKIYQFESTLNKMSIPQINLSWNESSITFRVMIQEKDIFKKHNFRYYVVGLNPEPIETTDQFITLHSLTSGLYTISVSYNLPNGKWSNPEPILKLNVAPPWWKTTWFTLFMISLILAVVTLTFIYFIRKKENKMRWTLQEKEKEMYSEKVRFLINISHELRTPLTLIYAPLKRMLNRPFDETSYNQINSIYKQAARMKETINMVLDLNKIETGNEKLIIKDHHLNDWIRETVTLFSTEFDYQNIKVYYNLDERISKVPFDKNKCDIVLSNILSNTLKFGTKHSSINISSVLHENENSVRISISDEGIGLQNLDSEKLFSRFYQGNHQRGGSGIGLAFSKTLIERHGGTIGAINNKNGKGATFFFELPLFSTENIGLKYEHPIVGIPPIENTNFSPHAEYRQIVTKSYSILFVEDNPELLEFLKQSLSQFFKNVYHSTNGLNALEIIKRDTPDVIVSDIVMPQMDGFELCRKVKSDISISHIPIILLTARGDSDSIQTGYKLGADAYVSKPFDIDFLLTIIENQLKVRETIKARYKEHNVSFTPQEITFSNADERFITKLNAIIYENISNPSLNVNFISTEIGMSRTSLYNKMNEILNIGMNDYINRIKFEKAAHMLISEPDLEIAEIASRLGFSSQRYFSTTFKHHNGVTPSEYRKKSI